MSFVWEVSAGYSYSHNTASTSDLSSSSNPSIIMHPDPVCAEPKLFVGGLRFEVTREELHNHFMQYGSIRSCVLLTHKDSGRSKGCGMVLYNKWAEAELAQMSENGQINELSTPRPLTVKFADPQR